MPSKAREALLSFVKTIRIKMKEINYNAFPYAGWQRWNKYFTNYPDYLTNPEACATHLAEYIPDYIDTVLQFGCGNGRDFVPFNKKLKLIGCDIAPPNYIKWIINFENLSYNRCCINDFASLNIRDFSKILIYTSGVMMYETPDNQKRFFESCLDLGCKNFIFQEYETGEYKGECLYLEEYKDFFIKKRYRDHHPNSVQPAAHILLDISDNNKKQILEKVSN